MLKNMEHIHMCSKIIKGMLPFGTITDCDTLKREFTDCEITITLPLLGLSLSVLIGSQQHHFPFETETIASELQIRLLAAL